MDNIDSTMTTTIHHTIVCKTAFGLHPATCLLSCCLLLISLSWLDPSALSVIFVAILALLYIFRVSQFLSLCYKSRFLLIITTFLFAWQTPGQLVLPVESAVLTTFLPTYEGIWLATEHLMLLLFFIAIVSLCLRLLDHHQLIIGLYRLLCWVPFVNASRFSVQFMLSLQQLVSLPPLSLDNFCQLLNPVTMTDASLPTTFILEEPRMIWVDYALIILVFLGTLCLWQIQ